MPSPLAGVPTETEEESGCKVLHENGWRWQVLGFFGSVRQSDKLLSGTLLPRERRRLQLRWRACFWHSIEEPWPKTWRSSHIEKPQP